MVHPGVGSFQAATTRKKKKIKFYETGFPNGFYLLTWQQIDTYMHSLMLGLTIADGNFSADPATSRSARAFVIVYVFG